MHYVLMLFALATPENCLICTQENENVCSIENVLVKNYPNKEICKIYNFEYITYVRARIVKIWARKTYVNQNNSNKWTISWNHLLSTAIFCDCNQHKLTLVHACKFWKWTLNVLCGIIHVVRTQNIPKN